MKENKWNVREQALFWLVAFTVAAVVWRCHQSLAWKDGGRPGKPSIKRYSESHAIIFAASQYNSWPSLPSAREDVLEVQTTLERHGFQVTIVIDPTRAKFDEELRKFLATHGENQDARLLIYFTGHGYTSKTRYGQNRRMGYLVPTDAPSPDENNLGPFKRKAINMDEISVNAAQIEAKHVLFVLDTCFSGAIFRNARESEESAPISEKTEQPVRQFITAGTENQTVPERSYFREMFVTALNGAESDQNKDGYITGSELGHFIRQRVTNHSKRQQTPQYGKINNPELDKGDIVFDVLRKSDPQRLSSLPVKDAETQEWERLENSQNIVDIDAFIEKYPNGRYTRRAHIAREKLLISSTNQRESNQFSTSTEAEPSLSLAEFTTASLINGQISRKQARCNLLIDDLGDGIKIELVRIRRGKYLMGALISETDHLFKSTPLREVTVSDFFMGRFEVTQELWRKVASFPKVEIPLMFNPSDSIGTSLPVENVTWREVKEFIARLNKKLGMTEKAGYRLPSEAEWEYAARAGTSTRFAFGDNINADLVVHDPSSRKYNISLQKRGNAVKEVGSRLVANAWGLFDMHGNVLEWCEDAWHNNYVGAPIDGKAWIDETPNRSPDRVCRGGSWYDKENYCRSSSRFKYSENEKRNDLGFRLARSIVR